MYSDNEIKLIKHLTHEIFDLVVEMASRDGPDVEMLDGSVVGLSFLANGDSSIERMAAYLVSCELVAGDFFEVRFERDSESINSTVDRLVSTVKPSGAKLDEIWCTFSEFDASFGLLSSIGVYIGYVGLFLNELPTTRKAFRVASNFKETMELFVLNGFALQNEDFYIWTDKIAKFMKFAVVWDRENKSIADLEKIKREAWEEEVLAAWNCIPDFFISKIFEEKKESRASSFAMFFSMYFQDGEWVFEPHEDSRTLKKWKDVKEFVREKSIL